MNSRQSGDTQEVAAAKAGISVRTGRRIDKGQHHERKPRDWRTRKDPFDEVWDSVLVPLLEKEPGLTGITLWVSANLTGYLAFKPSPISYSTA